MPARSTRSPRRSSRAPGCPRSPARRRRLLDASVALIDRSSAVLAVAGASPDQEKKLLAGGEDVTTVELRVADSAVGELRYRGAAPPDPTIARMVTTLLALELERSRSPEWESEEVAGAFVARRARPRGDRPRRHRRPRRRARRRPRARRRRADRCAPRRGPPRRGEWRARVLTLAHAGAALAGAGLAGQPDDGEEAAEIAVIVPAEDDDRLERAAAGLARELEDSLAGLPPDHRPQPPRRRPGRPLPRRQRGAAGGQRRRGRGPLAARLRGHRLLPPAAAGDERGPARARALLRRDDRAARRLRRPVRDRAGGHGRGLPRQRRQRRRHRQTALHPPPHDPLPARAGPASSAATTSPPPRAARSSASASKRCASSASPPRAARRWSPAPKRARCRALRRSSGRQFRGRARTLASRTKTRRASRLHHPGSGSEHSAAHGLDSLLRVRGRLGSRHGDGGASLDPEVREGWRAAGRR